MERIASFGVGSTNFRYAVGVTTGDFLTDVTVEPTQPHDLVAQTVEAAEELEATISGRLDGIAVTCPGRVDTETGVVRDIDTPEGGLIERIDLRSEVEAATDLPVYVENDCNASVLGEWYYGVSTEYESVAHVTFGTGIGGGVVERGQLVRGEADEAGEFGLLPIAPGSDLESSGVTGAWEACCSGRGIPSYAEKLLEDRPTESQLDPDEDFTAQDVFEAADAGDAFAQGCLERIHHYNAAGIAAICNSFNPGLVTVGGGVALNNQAEVIGGIETYLDEYLFVERPRIQISRIGDDIGLYGALASYRDAVETTQLQQADTVPES